MANATRDAASKSESESVVLFPTLLPTATPAIPPTNSLSFPSYFISPPTEPLERPSLSRPMTSLRPRTAELFNFLYLGRQELSVSTANLPNTMNQTTSTPFQKPPSKLYQTSESGSFIPPSTTNQAPLSELDLKILSWTRKIDPGPGLKDWYGHKIESFAGQHGRAGGGAGLGWGRSLLSPIESLSLSGSSIRSSTDARLEQGSRRSRSSAGERSRGQFDREGTGGSETRTSKEDGDVWSPRSSKIVPSEALSSDIELAHKQLEDAPRQDMETRRSQTPTQRIVELDDSINSASERRHHRRLERQRMLESISPPSPTSSDLFEPDVGGFGVKTLRRKGSSRQLRNERKKALLELKAREPESATCSHPQPSSPEGSTTFPAHSSEVTNLFMPLSMMGSRLTTIRHIEPRKREGKGLVDPPNDREGRKARRKEIEFGLKSVENSRVERESLHRAYMNIRDDIVELESIVGSGDIVKDADALRCVGQLLHSSDHPKLVGLAEGYFRKSLKMNPEQADLWEFMGRQAYEEKRYADALYYLDRAYLHSPNNPLVSSLIGDIFRIQQRRSTPPSPNSKSVLSDITGGIAAYEHCAGLVPRTCLCVSALYRLGLLYEAQKPPVWDRALEVWRTALIEWQRLSEEERVSGGQWPSEGVIDADDLYQAIDRAKEGLKKQRPVLRSRTISEPVSRSRPGVERDPTAVESERKQEPLISDDEVKNSKRVDTSDWELDDAAPILAPDDPKSGWSLSVSSPEATPALSPLLAHIAADILPLTPPESHRGGGSPVQLDGVRRRTMSEAGTQTIQQDLKKHTIEIGVQTSPHQSMLLLDGSLPSASSIVGSVSRAASTRSSTTSPRSRSHSRSRKYTHKPPTPTSPPLRSLDLATLKIVALTSSSIAPRAEFHALTEKSLAEELKRTLDDLLTDAILHKAKQKALIEAIEGVKKELEILPRALDDKVGETRVGRHKEEEVKSRWKKLLRKVVTVKALSS